MSITTSTLNTLRAMAIGRPVATAAAAAEALFHGGGKELLHEAPRMALRATVEKAASQVAAGSAPALVAQAARFAAQEAQAVAGGPGNGAAAMVQVARGGARGAMVRGAAKAVARSMGRAAGVGGALDGALGAVKAYGLLRRGTIDRKGAAKLVAVEGATGAASAALGVGAVAAVVALTGPIGFSAALLVAGATSAGSKLAMGTALHKLGVRTASSA
jgi:hypothetical protein